MKSVGNDIVALQYIDEQRTAQPAFYKKFITAGEQQLHPAVMPFTHFVWMLWAIKESAYKYLKRGQPDLVFSPIKIVVQSIATDRDTYNGVLHFQARQLHFLARIHPEYIAAIVNDEPNVEHIEWSIEQITADTSETQSAAVRKLVVDKLKDMLHVDNMEIRKSNVDYPVVYVNDKEQDIPLSFAHHGNYVSYAFLKDDNSDF